MVNMQLMKMEKSTANKTLWILFNLIDIILTKIIIHFAYGTELNPLASIMGLNLFIYVKALLSLYIGINLDKIDIELVKIMIYAVASYSLFNFSQLLLLGVINGI